MSPLLSTTELSEQDLSRIRKNCLKHFFVFCKTVMGYDDIIEGVHGEYCRFLESSESRKQVELPRSFVKTWIGTIAYSIWISLPRTSPDEFPDAVVSTTPTVPSNPTDAPESFPKQPYNRVPLPHHPGVFVDPFYLLGPNIRILIASYVVGNAMKMIGLIRKTYERNQAMQILFPEVIPNNFSKTKWADTEACIARSDNFTESTFEAGGIGGSTTSRHYDLIIEDDLIYANKDDFTGQELQPSQDDIDKAIGWHKLAMSLLVPGINSRIHNIGTRWAKHDLIDYVRTHEPDYVIFRKCITKNGELDGEPEWPEMYPRSQIQRIYASQGPYMFATQYLGKPMAPEDMIFRVEWLQYYVEPPKGMRIITTVDLSTWKTLASKKAAARASDGVIMTCGWIKNHCYILRYDVKRFNPSEVIDMLYVHHRLFNPELISIESVYYQAALAHFARIEMENRGWLPIRELNQHADKDVRIRALETYGSNGAIHCRADHKQFIVQWQEYVPGGLGKKDILDTLAQQLQVVSPSLEEEKPKAKPSYKDLKAETSMDDFLENCWRPQGAIKDPFDAYRLKPADILTQDEQLEFESIMAPLEIFQ